jgi:hypothetical protein
MPSPSYEAKIDEYNKEDKLETNKIGKRKNDRLMR